MGGGHFKSPPGQKSMRLPSPLVLDSGGQRVRDTAEPEPHQNKPSGGAVLAPRVHSWKTRQSARAGRALEEGGTVLSSPPLLSCSTGPALTAALRPSPRSGARGCHAHSEGRSGFCTVPPGFGDSTKAERGRSWKARHGSLEKHITNGDGDSGPRSRTATGRPLSARPGLPAPCSQVTAA